MSGECERAGVGGFGSPINPLSRNAAERNAPRARARLGTRVPVSPGQPGHGAREPCYRLCPLVRLPNAPAAAATAAAAPADAANYWPWSLERAGESPSCRARLRQALANQRAAQRAPGLGRGQCAGGGGAGPAGNLHTGGTKWYPSPRSRSKSQGRPGGQAQQGQEGRVEQGEERAGAATEPPQELRASRVCRDCRI